jgi:butyrate kinase
MTITQPTYTITTSALVDYLGTYSDTFTINAQTGTTYTLALADRGKLITMTNNSANVVTFPQNSSVALPIGANGTILQLGAGTTSVAAGTGATIISRGGVLTSAGTNGAITWVKISTNGFWVTGDLV